MREVPGVTAGNMELPKVPKELVAASATPLVLAILSKEESYGYAIIRDVRELSGGTLEWTDGMLYPILHRLEEQKLIKSIWRESDTGRMRKYYRITDAGKKALKTHQEQWNAAHAVLTRAWGRKLAYG